VCVFVVWLVVVVVVFNSVKPTAWATPQALFCVGFFQDRDWRTICLGWPQTMILLIPPLQ
jgi:hypothetical protein